MTEPGKGGDTSTAVLSPRRYGRLLGGQSAVDRTAAAVALVIAAIAPFIFSKFFVGSVLVLALWLGIAAASLIFLAGQGGMISLAQTAVYGAAGFTYADLVVKSGWDQWPAVFAGIGVAIVVAFVMGLIASRSEGIYFLMLTLAFGVLAYYFYLQVPQLSGQQGLHLSHAPSLVGSDPLTHPNRLYYAALIVSALVYVVLRYLARTPFGISLQGVRDEPVRMRSLGYRVGLHRTLAFTAAGVVAALAGIFSVFYNLQISPGSINITQIINILAIAVVGGIFRLEGAWVGALVFAVLDTYVFSWAGHLPGSLQKALGSERFPTWIGIVFLAIVLASPGGLMGIWEKLTSRFRGGAARQARDADVAQGTVGEASATRQS